MATARSLVVAADEVAAYHCIARCVRRAALCGDDPLTGRNFDHRKTWLLHRLQDLAEAFAIDIGGYAIMSNHLHLAVKTRPDLVRDWDDEEVFRRWRSIFPLRNRSKEALKIIAETEIANKKLMSCRRARLANISWFMRCLLEPIARRANAEDNCGGRFWEERFKCIGLLDETAVISCTAYIDLNPVRAGLVPTPEASEYTSVFDRIRQRQEQKVESAARDGWLAPISHKEKKTKPSRRVSHTPWLEMALDEYLELLDWTGRWIREDKPGAIPDHLPPILDRLKFNPAGWLRLTRNFELLFCRFAGKPESLEARAKSQGRKGLHGLSASREVFG